MKKFDTPMTSKKKKTIKINFRYFWDGFDPENNFFTDILRQEYNVEISDKPKYVFFSVYGEAPKNIGSIGSKIRKISSPLYIFLRKFYATLFPIKEPELQGKDKSAVKIFFNTEWQKPDMSKCDWAFGYAYEDEIKNSRYMRLSEYLYYGYQIKNKLIKNKDYVEETAKSKTKFCNFIYSNEVKHRNDFFKKLSKYKHIDSPGKCMNNLPPLELGGWRGKSYEERTKTKLDFMKQHKFTIAFENKSIPGYTDEKIFHAMLMGSIPIYFGNNLIHRDFNTKSFVNCHEFKNFEEVIKRVIEIDQNEELYKEILNQPWFHNNNPSEYFEDARILNRLKEIFG